MWRMALARGLLLMIPRVSVFSKAIAIRGN
jgi:hypothetical protein